jgi:hypothetical protein
MREHLEKILGELDKLELELILLRNQRMTKYQQTAKGYEKGQERRF